MKKLTVIISMTLFFLAAACPAGAVVDLLGGWTLQMYVVNQGGYGSETGSFRITDQQGKRFQGYSIPADPPKTDFYGIMDGRDIYITFYDSIVVGRVNKTGTKMRFIFQQLGLAPPDNPASGRGVATKE